MSALVWTVPDAGSIICIQRKSFYVLNSSSSTTALAPIVDGEVIVSDAKEFKPYRIGPWRLLKRHARLVVAP